MEKLLHSRLSELFRRAFHPLHEISRFRPEQKTQIDGVSVRADIYEWSLRGEHFNLALRRVSTNGFFSRGGERTECTLNGNPCPAFSVTGVEELLHDTGWRCSPGIESEENMDRNIERTEAGKRAWYDALPYFGAKGADITLDYFPEDEGTYKLSLSIDSDFPIDTDRTASLYIGFRDWRKGKEPSDEFRQKLIDIFRYWSPFITALGLEAPDLVDYYTILDLICSRGEEERLHYVHRKEVSRRLRSEEKSVTPKDYAWWSEGFTDSQRDRKIFFDWYEKEMGKGDERIADALREFGLTDSSTKEELKSAYRKKIRAFHPDVIGSKGLDPAFLSFAEGETERLTQLYELLLTVLR